MPSTRSRPSLVATAATELHLWRLHYLTRNSLVRPIDRWEFAGRLLVMAWVVVLLPLCFAVGGAAHQGGMAEVARERAERHIVTALVLETPTAGQKTVTAGWTGQHGPHRGTINATDADKRGTTRLIWIDRQDEPALPPRTPGSAVAQGVLAGIGCAAALVGTGALAVHLLTSMTNRRRHRAWDHEWERARLRI